jgi:hypothetical protein
MPPSETHVHNPALVEASRAKGTPVGYSMVWDRYYLKDSGVWLEPKCSNAACPYCLIAPENFKQWQRAS